MKILFLSRSLGLGGAERQLTELARGLQTRGAQVAVALFYPSKNLEFEEELRAAGVTLHHLNVRLVLATGVADDFPESDSEESDQP